MTKRIFRSVLFTAMISVLLAAVLIVYSMFNVYEKEMMDELCTEADYLTYALERETDETAYFEGFSSANRVIFCSMLSSICRYSSFVTGSILSTFSISFLL